jgi:hypothetical protein
MVFIRCADIHSGRVSVKFSEVLPVNTKPAPIRASVIIKIKAPTAVFLIECARSYLRKAQISKIKTAKNANALVIRCENSMIVFNSGADGIISPWHVSQCCPQPSPDLEARKNTPHSMTIKL